MNNPALTEVTRATGPYPGLRPFRDDETEIFFGREAQTDRLLEKLQSSHFIAVVGPSGCGKSSLVRAGLIAALETGFLADAGAGWRVAEMRPGDRPLARLAAALLAPSALGPERGMDASEVAIGHAMLRRGPLGLVEILRETQLPARENLLLLIDQFEEIFRFREQGSAADADAFVALLLASSAQREVPIYVVLTMRSDFLGDCALFTGLPEAINDGQYLTPRLSREQIRAAITGPARVFGGDVEPALVNRLLNEIGPDPDQLPLLQHALMRMWARVKERNAPGESVGLPEGAPPSALVTMADYVAVGALSEALSSHADQVLHSLSDRQQHIARVMLSRLTERAVGKRDTRRPARLDDVAAVAGVAVQEVTDVVEQFRRPERSFLTPPPPVPITAETVLDIGHESLIRQWHQLDDWVEEEAASAAMYRRLLQTAHLWDAGKAALWSSPDLDEALTWKQARSPSKPWALRYGTGEEFELAMNFLHASADQAARLRRQALAAAEHERALQQKAKRSKLTFWGVVVLSFFVIIIAYLAWETWKLSKTFHSRELAIRAAQPLQTDPELGLLLALEAHRTAPTPQAKAALQRAGLASKLRGKISLEVWDRTLSAPRLTPDGNFAVAWDRSPSDPKVYIWDIKAGGQPRVIDAHGPSTLIALSPDRQSVVIPDSESSVRVWETATGQPVTGPLHLEGTLARAFFGPHGGVLGVMTNAGQLGLWETQTWRPLPPIEVLLRPQLLPALSDDSKYLVAASQDRALRVWETATGHEVALIGDETIRASTASFSPDGKYVVVVTTPERVAKLWSMESKEWIRDIGDERHPVDRVLFSPDGSQYVAFPTPRLKGGSDGEPGEVEVVARVGSVEKSEKSEKDLTHPIIEAELPGEYRTLPVYYKNGILIADFSPDGKLILTVASGVLRIWPSPFDSEPMKSSGHTGDVRTAHFSQGSHWIVSTGRDGSAKLWDAITGRIVANFSGGSMLEAWLSKDSRRLHTTSPDGTVRIWDTLDFGSITELSELPAHERPLRSKSDPTYAAAMTRNGKYLLAIASDGVARIWNSSTGYLKAQLGKASRVRFSPNGKYAITTGTDKTARVWEVETGRDLASSAPRNTDLITANFSDDAHPWTWYKDGWIDVWELKDGKPSVISSIRHLGNPGCVTVSPDVLWLAVCEQQEEQQGRTDVVQGRTDVVQVLKLPSGEEGPLLRGHTGYITDVFFSQDGKFAVSTSNDRTAKIWDVGSWKEVNTKEVNTLEGHGAGVNYAIFSPDTKYVVTVSLSTLRVWETATGKFASELRGHTAPIRAVAFSADGQWLVTGSDDQTARVWDPTTGGAVAELYGHRDSVIAVAFVDNSKEIVTASADGTIRRYRCDACVPSSELQAVAQQRLDAIGRPSLTPHEKAQYVQ